ncbi:MAG: cell division protein FtsZ, partial [Alphaproteobacteria bacterium]
EALARLRHAVSRQNDAGHAAAPAPAAPKQPESRPRFGINSLINRMTGHGQAEAAPRPQPTLRDQPLEEPESDPEHDRVEIPAFLRRQAN